MRIVSPASSKLNWTITVKSRWSDCAIRGVRKPNGKVHGVIGRKINLILLGVLKNVNDWTGHKNGRMYQSTKNEPLDSRSMRMASSGCRFRISFYTLPMWKSSTWPLMSVPTVLCLTCSIASGPKGYQQVEICLIEVNFQIYWVHQEPIVLVISESRELSPKSTIPLPASAKCCRARWQLLRFGIPDAGIQSTSAEK